MTSAPLANDRPELQLAIVIPAYNAVPFLPQVLPAVQAAAGEARVVVVDPGSSDGTASLAQDLGAEVIQLAKRAGPAEARNAGAAATPCDVLVFIDSDCVPHADLGKRIREAFVRDPNLVSVTGSYDDAPPEPGFFSQYMNLRHHFTHQSAPETGAIFWAGCGAVRRDVFLAVGGFDAERFPTPQIEDIELGLRLASHGAMRLDRELQVTHLKRWTLRTVVETDIFARAIPWSRLILERRELPDALNTRASQRIAAGVAPLALLGLLVAPFALFAGAWGLALAAVLPTAVAIGLNFSMLRAFLKLRGVAFAAGAFLFHQIHLCYGAATFAACWIGTRL